MTRLPEGRRGQTPQQRKPNKPKKQFQSARPLQSLPPEGFSSPFPPLQIGGGCRSHPVAGEGREAHAKSPRLLWGSLLAEELTGWKRSAAAGCNEQRGSALPLGCRKSSLGGESGAAAANEIAAEIPLGAVRSLRAEPSAAKESSKTRVGVGGAVH